MKLMRLFLLLISLFAAGFASPPAPRYVPRTLGEMVMDAQLAVHGTIVEVKSKTFVIEVQALIKGELTPADKQSKQLTVRRFQNWSCAARWADYAKGQEVVLFLGASGETGRVPGILSGGGEGEMPVVTETDDQGHRIKKLIVRGLAGEKVGERQTHKVSGGEVPGVAMDLAATLQSIQEFHACFEVKVVLDKHLRDSFESTQLVPEERVQKLAVRSTLGRYLVGQGRKHLVPAEDK